jgi:hypothetical protein
MQQHAHRETPAAVRRRPPGRAARNIEGQLERPGTAWVGLPQNARRVYCGACLKGAVRSASRSILGPADDASSSPHLDFFVPPVAVRSDERHADDGPDGRLGSGGIGRFVGDWNLPARCDCVAASPAGRVAREWACPACRSHAFAGPQSVPSARRPYRGRREPQAAQRTERAVAELNRRARSSVVSGGL